MLNLTLHDICENIQFSLTELARKSEKHKENYHAFLDKNDISQAKNITKLFPKNTDIEKLAREANHFEHLLNSRTVILSFGLSSLLSELKQYPPERLNAILNDPKALAELKRAGEERAKFSKEIDELMKENRISSEDRLLLVENNEQIKKIEERKNQIFDEINAKGKEYNYLCLYFESLLVNQFFLETLDELQIKIEDLEKLLETFQVEIDDSTEIEENESDHEDLGGSGDFLLALKKGRQLFEELKQNQAEETEEYEELDWGSSDESIQLSRCEPSLSKSSEEDIDWGSDDEVIDESPSKSPKLILKVEERHPESKIKKCK